MSPVKGEDPLAGYDAAPGQSTDKSVCATLAFACISIRPNFGRIHVAQTLLSVLVRLGTAKKTTRCFVDFLTNCEPSSRGDDGGGRRQRASAQSTDNRQRARSAHLPPASPSLHRRFRRLG